MSSSKLKKRPAAAVVAPPAKISMRDPSDVFTLQRYAQHLLGKLGLRPATDKPKFTVATGCSGAGFFEQACCAILGTERVDVAFASELHPATALFLHRHSRPRCIFADINAASRPGAAAYCRLHDGLCKVPNTLQHAVSIGFVCKPFSVQKPRRFHSSPIKPPGEDPDVDTYYGVVEHLRKHRCLVAVLENTSGIAMGVDPPIDFIMNDKEWGLKNIPGKTAAYIKLKGTDVALPMVRDRIFFLVVDESVGPADELRDEIAKIVRLYEGVHHLESFLLPRDDPAFAVHASSALSGTKPSSAHGTEAIRAAVTQERDYADAFDTVFAQAVETGTWVDSCDLRPSEQRLSKRMKVGGLTGRQRAVIDVLEPLAAQAAGSSDAKHVHPIADCSQSIYRAHIRVDGTVPTLTTSSTLVSFLDERFIIPREEMAMLGYPLDALNLAMLTESQARTLAGNGVCATAVCACAIAVMAKLGFLVQ
jgi:site-specific DNA-cytosine methylase